MARISLVEAENTPAIADLVQKFKSGRRGKLLNIYKLLLHNKAAAEGWFDFINTVRWKIGLEGRLRELVIIRIGYLNRVDYVINQHVPELAEAEGLTLAQCNGLAEWKNSSLFSDADRAVLAYTDSMSQNIQVPNSIYNAVSQLFNEAELVALTLLIGTYNMHTRVFQALEIDLEESK